MSASPHPLESTVYPASTYPPGSTLAIPSDISGRETHSHFQTDAPGSTLVYESTRLPRSTVGLEYTDSEFVGPSEADQEEKAGSGSIGLLITNILFLVIFGVLFAVLVYKERIEKEKRGEKNQTEIVSVQAVARG
jgi:hypothetical protein